jgi:hypothetical protein
MLGTISLSRSSIGRNPLTLIRYGEKKIPNKVLWGLGRPQTVNGPYFFIESDLIIRTIFFVQLHVPPTNTLSQTCHSGPIIFAQANFAKKIAKKSSFSKLSHVTPNWRVGCNLGTYSYERLLCFNTTK